MRKRSRLVWSPSFGQEASNGLVSLLLVDVRAAGAASSQHACILITGNISVLRGCIKDRPSSASAPRLHTERSISLARPLIRRCFDAPSFQHTPRILQWLLYLENSLCWRQFWICSKHRAPHTNKTDTVFRRTTRSSSTPATLIKIPPRS